MTRGTIIVWLLLTVTAMSRAQSSNVLTPTPGNDLTKSGIDTIFSKATARYAYMKSLLKPGLFPRSYVPKSNKLVTSGPEWWCSGFYPGALLYMYQETNNKQLLEEALRVMKTLEKEQYDSSTHDLGFMMYCSFGHLYRLKPDDHTRQILINSANSLASRFNPKVGCIKSWNAKASDFIVIIDNMMNLELLFWAAKATGDKRFYDIAVTHANTTMKHHFREDYSSYHVINYDPATGLVQQKKTAQGYADQSAWARGQAWGLYGYTVMYRETKDKKYLQQAERISSFILKHPNFPADGIAYWDFNAPDIPQAFRDASAAAVMSAAWLELAKYSRAENKARYTRMAKKILKELASTRYTAPARTNGGFILEHSVGYWPEQYTEVDQPLTYADYYYLEALASLKKQLTN